MDAAKRVRVGILTPHTADRSHFKALRELVPDGVSLTVQGLNLTAGDAMSYSMPTIDAKPGEQLKIVLKVTTAQPPEQLKHNFVLLAPDTDPMQFAMAAVMAKDTGYIPAEYKTKILAQSEMAAGGQEVQLIPVVAVPAAGQQQKQAGRGGDQRQRHPGERWSGARRGALRGSDRHGTPA